MSDDRRMSSGSDRDPVRHDRDPIVTRFAGTPFAARVSWFAVMCGASACVRTLPAAPIPAAIAPAGIRATNATSAIPSERNRLIVDVVDGYGPIQRVAMRGVATDNGRGRTTYRFSEDMQIACAKPPCELEIAVGNAVLGFPVLGRPNDVELELVHVGEQPEVYRRTLSVYDDRSGGLQVLGIVMASVGGASMTTGTVLLPIGLATSHDSLSLAGGATLAAGAAVLAFGIWALRHDADTFRPGSANHYLLKDAQPTL